MTAGPDPGPVRVELNRLGRWSEEVPELAPLLERAARLALGSGEAGLRGSLSVTLLSEGEIAELNRRWLGRDEPTDVISFELGDDELMADVYVAPEVARRRAREAGVTLREELARLTIHGVLHALGHDHPEGGDRWESPMFRLQEGLVARATGSE